MQRKVSLFVAFTIFALSLVGCTTQSEPASTTATEEPISTPIPAAREVDYVDVQNNPDDYEGEFIRVAGQITNFSMTDDYSFYFNDRLQDFGFCIEMSHQRTDSSIKNTYDIGDYIVVEGVWKNYIYGNRLEDATLVYLGEAAKNVAKVYLDSWESNRKDFALSSPLLNYMDIFNDESYDGQYVRFVGKVSESQTNGVTNYHNIVFRDIYTGVALVHISLQGCPFEMQNSCTEGKYIIISGEIDTGEFSASMSDCYVECIGEEAEKEFQTIIERSVP